MDLVLATNNDNKRTELAHILSGHRLLIPSDLGLGFDFAETGGSFLDNALGKARALRGKVLEIPEPPLKNPWAVIADDSGLCVDALGGRPGIYSARYGSPDGGVTELPSADRNRLLLAELRGIADRSAHFVCCMAALLDDQRFVVAQERWDGEIAEAPSRGRGGFGYDPIFYIPELGVTAADLPPAEKNRLSHRGMAASKLARLLQGELDRG